MRFQRRIENGGGGLVAVVVPPPQLAPLLEMTADVLRETSAIRSAATSGFAVQRRKKISIALS
jgi:hypothetical protein